MTGRLNRNEIARIVGGDPRAIREFERILGQVQANISGPSAITLNYASDGTLTSPLPVTASYTLAGGDGNAFRSGVQWGVTVLSGSFVGTGPTIGGTGTGFLQINSGLASPSALIAVTARDQSGYGYAPFSVSIVRSTAAPDVPSGGGSSSDSTSSLLVFNSSSFAPITRELSITLPALVTDATLTSGSVFLELSSAAPAGATTVEMKWQRETAPSVWSDVGAVATSGTDPTVAASFDGVSLIYEASPGSIICNRTETGMAAGSAQKFRLVARVSAGVVRSVVPVGNVSVTS